jgi:hypothetical protein
MKTEWKPATRLPLVGGPLGHQHRTEHGSTPCESVHCPQAKTRAINGMTYRRADWPPGEYRRTTTTWQWTPPPGRTNPTTEVINHMRLAHHPTPAVLANHGRDVAARIREHGPQVILRAAVLAARGLPANTAGNGSRGSDPTSSTERAAGASGDGDDEHDPPMNLTPPNSEWLNIDVELAQLHRDWWRIGVQLLAAYDRIQSQGSDDDPIPAGTGSCRRCDLFWRPTAEKPNNRIRSSYGPCCYFKWVRLGKPDKAWFDRTPDEDVA